MSGFETLHQGPITDEVRDQLVADRVDSDVLRLCELDSAPGPRMKLRQAKKIWKGANANPGSYPMHKVRSAWKTIARRWNRHRRSWWAGLSEERRQRIITKNIWAATAKISTFAWVMKKPEVVEVTDDD